MRALYLSAWALCFVAWLLIDLNFLFHISFIGCDEVCGVVCTACGFFVEWIGFIFYFGLISLPVLSIFAILHFLLSRRWGGIDLCFLFASWVLFGLSATHFTSY